MTTPKRRRPENLGGVHEFEVGITDLYGDGSRLHYVVQLPHSCDQWVISLAATFHAQLPVRLSLCASAK